MPHDDLDQLVDDRRGFPAAGLQDGGGELVAAHALRAVQPHQGGMHVRDAGLERLLLHSYALPRGLNAVVGELGQVVGMQVSLQDANVVDDGGLEDLSEVITPVLAGGDGIGEHVAVSVGDALRRRGGLAGECAHDAVELLRVAGSSCSVGCCGLLVEGGDL
eukprot:10401480-Heterocapsa_arctica.AAC.1